MMTEINLSETQQMLLPDQIEPDCHQPNTSSCIGSNCQHSAKFFSDKYNSRESQESQGNQGENSLLTIPKILSYNEIPRESMAHAP